MRIAAFDLGFGQDRCTSRAPLNLVSNNWTDRDSSLKLGRNLVPRFMKDRIGAIMRKDFLRFGGSLAESSKGVEITNIAVVISLVG
jgi:hypothetical protein